MPAVRELISWLTLGRTRVRIADRPDTIFLTFDDGPHPVHTPRLLQTLARHEVRATFFVIGNTLAQHRAVAEQVHAAGHVLANHSTSHPWFHRISRAHQRQEIELTDSALQAIDGREQHWFRPPHGRVSVGCMARTLIGPLRMALWTTDSLDYRLPADEVVTRLRATNVRGGDILLFHDDAAVAADVLERLLPEWRAAGLRCDALPEPGAR